MTMQCSWLKKKRKKNKKKGSENKSKNIPESKKIKIWLLTLILPKLH